MNKIKINRSATVFPKEKEEQKKFESKEGDMFNEEEKQAQVRDIKSFGFLKRKTFDFSHLQRPSNYVDIERLWNYEQNILDYRILELTSK